MVLDGKLVKNREEIYSKLRQVLSEMDIVQALDDLEHRLISLRDRTASRITIDQPNVPEVKSKPAEVIIIICFLYKRLFAFCS
mgnify:CR=1 FL=1